jgi:tRNA (uracil-5-)-methyltransferase TRM9
MNTETQSSLIEINRRFYAAFAASFAESRQAPQPGFKRLLGHAPQPLQRMVDVGCGNGRFGRYMSERSADLVYVGVDFTAELLDLAAANVQGDFYQRDLSEPGFLEELGQFDLCVCLATMQHIPGKEHRLQLLKEMAGHLAAHGRIFLSNWQFVQSERQQRKILPWSAAGLRPEDLDPNDYLLSWNRDGQGMRYVHLLESEEIHWLADRASLSVVDEFRSDGREEDLNFYIILAR